jgi:hypothetical protein
MRTNKKEETKKQYEIDMIHHGFTKNLESLGVFIINLSPMAEKYDKVITQRAKETLEEALEIMGVSKNELKRKGKKTTPEFKPTKEQISKLVSVLKGLHYLAPFQVKLLYKSSFVMLVSYFDFLISDLIHYFYQTYPESLSGKELSITLNELKLFDHLTEAINHVVSKEVDNVLYGNLEDQKRYFENYLKIDLKESIIHWGKINEAIERRNIIVHNNSKINRRYLRNVDLSVIPGKTKDLKEGKEIGIDKDYFTIVFDEILIAGIILTQNCWRKWRKDNIDGADSQLIDDMHDALSKEKWTVAERLGLFAKECKVFNERNRLYLDINYCQSLKWQNKKDELEKELEKFDTSTLSPIYILALSALKSDRDSFYKNVEKAIIVDKMEEADFMEWPLFRELRKNRDYEERIKIAFISVSKKAKVNSKNSDCLKISG